MNTRKRIASAVALLGVLVLPAVGAERASAASSDWIKITAPTDYTANVNGVDRQVTPRCITGGVTNDDRYSFYYKAGASNKLVVFFNGGGACWNAQTCILGAIGPNTLYVPTADSPFSDPTTWGGLLDTDAKKNPFKEWSMVFLPYCTADVHIGSKNTLYQLDPAMPPVPITHRGFDNFLYARDWIARQGLDVDRLVVAGASAGAYGAALNFPYLKQLFPSAQASLVGDGGSGVITGDFMDAALDESWGGAANLAPQLQVLHDFASPLFVPALYGLLTFQYPKDRFSQYTTAWDARQTLFYDIMRDADTPQEWGANLDVTFPLWHAAMRGYALATSVAPNYRYYIAPGCRHTILAFSDRFYSNAKVGGVSFLDWLSAQTGNANTAGAWRNVSACPANAPCPFPSQEELAGCFQERL